MSVIFRVFGLHFYCLSTKVSLNKNNIQDWINNKKPLFVTGTSTQNNTGSNLSYLFSGLVETPQTLRLDHLSSIKTASAVALICENQDEIEVVMAPIGLSVAVYPITIFNDSIVICTRNPKPGNSYNDVNAYPLNDFVFFTKNAIELGEISEVPYEMSSAYLKRFFYSVRNIAQCSPSNPSELKCIIQKFMDKYKWLDEFQKQDYLDKYLEDCSVSYLPLRSQMSRPSTLEPFYVEIKAKLGEYSFEKSAFPFRLGKMTGFSTSLSGWIMI